jgi:hypothetical protein
MEQRRHERFSTDIPVKIRIPGGAKDKAPKFEGFATLKDVSLGGAFVTSGFRFKNEIDRLEIDILFDGGALPIKGRVVRQPDGGLAIQFVEMGTEERANLLKHFVPDSHKAFYEDIAKKVLPSIGVDRVSLIIHLWEEYRRSGAAEGGAKLSVKTAPKPTPSARSATPTPTPSARPAAPAPRGDKPRVTARTPPRR